MRPFINLGAENSLRSLWIVGVFCAFGLMAACLVVLAMNSESKSAFNSAAAEPPVLLSPAERKQPVASAPDSNNLKSY